MEEECASELEAETEPTDADDTFLSDDFGIKFPIPPQEDESLCRDEYLRTLFANFEPMETVAARRTMRSDSIFRARRTGTFGGIGNAEAMAIIRMIRKNRRAVEFKELTEFKVSLSAAEKQAIYKTFIIQFKKAAIEMLSVKLKKRLEIFVNIWPGDINPIPYYLFHWSIEHFLVRTRINQLYLDVLTIERTEKELNCAKFCTDVNEILRILNAIRQDVRTDEDLCNSSIALINDADFDDNAPWLLGLQEKRELRSKLGLQVFAQHDNRDKIPRDSTIGAENKRHDAYLPIELRYRINWIRSNGEQHLMWLQSREQALQTELDQLNDQIRENSLAYEFRDYVYQFQVDKYRMSIAKWEEQLEVDMENLELQCSMTRTLYAKARDDLKFYTDQVEMFKHRIAQVLQQEEDDEQTKRSQKMRRGTRISTSALKRRSVNATQKKQKKSGKVRDSLKK